MLEINREHWDERSSCRHEAETFSKEQIHKLRARFFIPWDLIPSHIAYCAIGGWNSEFCVVLGVCWSRSF